MPLVAFVRAHAVSQDSPGQSSQTPGQCKLKDVYAFAQRGHARPMSLWANVVRELRWMHNLLPLVVCDQRANVATRAMAADASMDGPGVIVGCASQDAAYQLLGIARCGDAETRGCARSGRVSRSWMKSSAELRECLRLLGLGTRRFLLYRSFGVVCLALVFPPRPRGTRTLLRCLLWRCVCLPKLHARLNSPMAFSTNYRVNSMGIPMLWAFFPHHIPARRECWLFPPQLHGASCHLDHGDTVNTSPCLKGRLPWPHSPKRSRSAMLLGQCCHALLTTWP